MGDEQQSFAKVVPLLLPLEKHEKELRDIFGENYEIVVRIAGYLTSFVSYIQNGGSGQLGDELYSFRDEHSLENIRFLLNTLPEDAKFFAQFGAGHIYQTPVDEVVGSKNFHRLGTRLNEGRFPLKGQVCSILYMVENKSGVTKRMNLWVIMIGLTTEYFRIILNKQHSSHWIWKEAPSHKR